jgi:hypothetical protein
LSVKTNRGRLPSIASWPEPAATPTLYSSSLFVHAAALVHEVSQAA